MISISEQPGFQKDVEGKKKTRRAPLYQVFLIVSGPLTGEESGLGIELPEQCEEALRTVFELEEHAAVQAICETLSKGQSLVGEFTWEIADDKVILANAMLRNNNFKPPFDRPVSFGLRKS